MREQPRVNGKTRGQLEERACAIQRMYNRGRTQWDIAKRFGISQVMVSKILKKNRERLKLLTLEETAEWIEIERERYREVIEAAWKSYWRSLKDAERDEWGWAGGEDEAPPEFKIVKKTREGQAGNSGFLQVILKAMRDRNELLGLVKNATVNNTNVVAAGPNLQQALDAAPDPVEERLQAAAEMPDRSEP